MNDAFSVELIGWLSSLTLFVTLLIQIRRQWRARRTEGVSPWLFLGQLAANVGFIVYASLIGARVFVVTASLLAATAITGFIVLRVHRRRERAGPLRQVEAYAVPGAGAAGAGTSP
jgi:MtN3 and saliva related transmembrane protein